MAMRVTKIKKEYITTEFHGVFNIGISLFLRVTPW
jgi:hypothetical protein